LEQWILPLMIQPLIYQLGKPKEIFFLRICNHQPNNVIGSNTWYHHVF
jgi:hypothetical protein